MMVEYINREKAFNLIKEQKEKETGAYSKGRNKGLIIAGSIINNKEVLPTADVVEVVRCGKCKYYDLHHHMCLNPLALDVTYVDKYCSYGERKNEDSN